MKITGKHLELIEIDTRLLQVQSEVKSTVWVDHFTICTKNVAEFETTWQQFLLFFQIDLEILYEIMVWFVS